MGTVPKRRRRPCSLQHGADCGGGDDGCGGVGGVSGDGGGGDGVGGGEGGKAGKQRTTSPFSIYGESARISSQPL